MSDGKIVFKTMEGEPKTPQSPVAWFEAQIFPTIGWARVFGHGIHYKYEKRHGSTFSERYGYVHSVKIFGWRFRYMEPRK